MEELFYSVVVNDFVLQLEENSLGYCFNIKHQGQTRIFIYTTLNDSLDMMESAINFLQLAF